MASRATCSSLLLLALLRIRFTARQALTCAIILTSVRCLLERRYAACRSSITRPTSGVHHNGLVDWWPLLTQRLGIQGSHSVSSHSLKMLKQTFAPASSGKVGSAWLASSLRSQKSALLKMASWWLPGYSYFPHRSRMKPFDDWKTQVYHTPPHYPELAPPRYKEPNPGHGPPLWARAPFALDCVVQQSLLIACPGPLLSLWPNRCMAG